MINQEKTLEQVDRSQRKDTTAFAQLVTEFQPMVFRLAFRLLCDEDEARDITQETFVKVWLSLIKLTPGLEEEVITFFPLPAPPYTILIAATSLSAWSTTMPVVSHGFSSASVSNTSDWGVIG